MSTRGSVGAGGGYPSRDNSFASGKGTPGTAPKRPSTTGAPGLAVVGRAPSPGGLLSSMPQGGPQRSSMTARPQAGSGAGSIDRTSVRPFSISDTHHSGSDLDVSGVEGISVMRSGSKIPMPPHKSTTPQASVASASIGSTGSAAVSDRSAAAARRAVPGPGPVLSLERTSMESIRSSADRPLPALGLSAYTESPRPPLRTGSGFSGSGSVAPTQGVRQSKILQSLADKNPEVMEASARLGSAEFIAFEQEVAARIIQHYWREYRQIQELLAAQAMQQRAAQPSLPRSSKAASEHSARGEAPAAGGPQAVRAVAYSAAAPGGAGSDISTVSTSIANSAGAAGGSHSHSVASSQAHASARASLDHSYGTHGPTPRGQAPQSYPQSQHSASAYGRPSASSAGHGAVSSGGQGTASASAGGRSFSGADGSGSVSGAHSGDAAVSSRSGQARPQETLADLRRELKSREGTGASVQGPPSQRLSAAPSASPRVGPRSAAPSDQGNMSRSSVVPEDVPLSVTSRDTSRSHTEPHGQPPPIGASAVADPTSASVLSSLGGIMEMLGRFDVSGSGAGRSASASLSASGSAAAAAAGSTPPASSAPPTASQTYSQSQSISQARSGTSGATATASGTATATSAATPSTSTAATSAPTTASGAPSHPVSKPSRPQLSHSTMSDVSGTSFLTDSAARASAAVSASATASATASMSAAPATSTASLSSGERTAPVKLPQTTAAASLPHAQAFEPAVAPLAPGATAAQAFLPAPRNAPPPAISTAGFAAGPGGPSPTNGAPKTARFPGPASMPAAGAAKGRGAASAPSSPLKPAANGFGQQRGGNSKAAGAAAIPSISPPVVSAHDFYRLGLDSPLVRKNENQAPGPSSFGSRPAARALALGPPPPPPPPAPAQEPTDSSFSEFLVIEDSFAAPAPPAAAPAPAPYPPIQAPGPPPVPVADSAEGAALLAAIANLLPPAPPQQPPGGLPVSELQQDLREENRAMRASLDVAAARSSVSADKIRGLLDFLDEVERASDALGGPAPQAAQPQGGAGAGRPQKNLATISGAGMFAGLKPLGGPLSGVETPALIANPTAQPDGNLAGTIYDGVRNKIRRLEEEIAAQAAAVAGMTRQLDSAQEREKQLQSEFEARLQESLARQRVEFEGAIARQLAFMDRLMKEKEDLSRRCAELASDTKTLHAQVDLRTSELSGRFGEELKRHREAWAAAEKQRREAWMAEKTREIKEMTVRGLEPDIQRLVVRHKQELERAEERLAADARRQLQDAQARHDEEIRSLKDRLARERDEALEKEREACQAKLRDATDRNDAALSAARSRLAQEADARVEAADKLRREERRQMEDQFAQYRRDCEERLAGAASAVEREKLEWQKKAEKDLLKVKEMYEADREGWRAAALDKLRREMNEREREIRRQLERERDEELAGVIARLDAETAQAAREAERKHSSREEALVKRYAEEVRALKESEARAGERLKQVVEREQLARDRCDKAEAAAEALRVELHARSQTVGWMEQQVQGSKAESERRERDLRRLFEEREASARKDRLQAEAETQDMRKRVAEATRELENLKARHMMELQSVEQRVRSTVARKDEAIGALKDQVVQLQRQLKAMETLVQG